MRAHAFIGALCLAAGVLLAPIGLWAGVLAAAPRAAEHRGALIAITGVISSACVVLLLAGLRLRRAPGSGGRTPAPRA